MASADFSGEAFIVGFGNGGYEPKLKNDDGDWWVARRFNWIITECIDRSGSSTVTICSRSPEVLSK
jgi:hypothetical protein